MKLNTLLIGAALVSTSLSSCVNSANERQVRYTHTSRADGDAYAFFNHVGNIAPYELGYAEYVQTVGDSKAKEAASKVSAFFTEILPAVDELATQYKVDFPVLGAAEFEAPVAAVNQADSSNVEPAAQPAFSTEAYLAHLQEQIGIVKTHLDRLSRDTNTDFRAFAEENEQAVSDLFTAVGGHVEEHGHH